MDHPSKRTEACLVPHRPSGQQRWFTVMRSCSLRKKTATRPEPLRRGSILRRRSGSSYPRSRTLPENLACVSFTTTKRSASSSANSSSNLRRTLILFAVRSFCKRRKTTPQCGRCSLKIFSPKSLSFVIEIQRPVKALSITSSSPASLASSWTENTSCSSRSQRATVGPVHSSTRKRTQSECADSGMKALLSRDLLANSRHARMSSWARP